MRPLYFSTIALLASCGWFLCACAHSRTETEHQPAKEHVVMATPESAVNQNPISAAEIGQRFLKLIAGLQSRNDLSLERIQEVLGVTLTFKPGALSAAVASPNLGEGWRYIIDFIPESPSLQKGVGLSFWNSNEDHISSVTPICGLDFEYYHKALVEMGFIAEPYYGEHNLFLDWRYTKFKKSDGTVDMTISIVQMAGNEPGQVCVKSIGTLNGR